MPQAATKNFAGLTALRILSGAFEAIADPAFMLFTSMFYTRAEQPSRISAWYCFNGLGVAGGGLIGMSNISSPIQRPHKKTQKENLPDAIRCSPFPSALEE